MAYTQQTKSRLRQFTYPISIPEDVHGFTDRNSLIKLADFNASIGNSMSSSILRLIGLYCCEGIEELVSNESKSDQPVWYQWGWNWSPGVIKQVDGASLVVESRRKRRTTNGIGILQNIRKDREPIYASWFELQPRTGPQKPEAIMNTEGFPVLAAEIRKLDIGVEMESLPLLFPDLTRQITSAFSL